MCVFSVCVCVCMRACVCVHACVRVCMCACVHTPGTFTLFHHQLMLLIEVHTYTINDNLMEEKTFLSLPIIWQTLTVNLLE